MVDSPRASPPPPRPQPAHQPAKPAPAQQKQPAPKPQSSQPSRPATQAQAKDTYEAGKSQAAAKPAPAAEKAGPPAPKPTKGEQQAQDAVKVKTVGQERAALEQGGKDAQKKNTEAADHVFSLAGKDQKDLPPGVEPVKSNDPNRAELVARNKDGDVTARTVAIRDGDKTTIQKTTWEHGRANYTSTTSAPNGDFSTTQASWKESPSKDPQSPSVDSLKNSRNPDVQVQQQSVHRDGDKLVESDYSQGKTGITQTSKEYFQQSKDDATHSGDGIKDDFEDKFSDSKPVDVVNTHTISIPAGGQKGPDGKPAAPQESESATFSQGNMRLERDAGTQQFKLDDDLPKDFHPAASDAAQLDDLPGFTKEDKSPVQWKLEENQGNTYDAQTFVEGHTDLSTTTHREAHGSTVTETVSGKVPPEDGDDPVDISSKTTQTYAQDGSLAHLHKDATDPDGSRTVTDFDRTTKPSADGLQIDEHLDVRHTDEDGQTSTVDRKTQSLLSNQGVQLVSSDETVTGPDGTTGRTLLDKDGAQTFINGQEVKDKKDLAGYSLTAQRLATQSGADTFKEAQSYINNGGVNAVKLLGIGNKLPAPANGAQPTALTDANNELNQKLVDKFGQENVDTAFRVQGGLAGATQVAGGLAGAVSSANDVVEGIRSQDFGKIATGVAGEIASGNAIKTGGKAFLDAVRGLAPETVSADAKAVNTALKTAGWLDKVPGVSEDLATSGGIAAGTASKFLSKLGGAAAVVGVAASGYELYNAIDSGNGYKIAQASVGLAGAAGAIAIGATIGSVEPGLGTLIGAGIGLATFGVQQIIGLFDHSETDIADVKI
ncbi:MAG TPA: hypothetical protein VND93_26465 [Myxococcales bacterium]|nr:hypothetical protein [Myxococcales bacterium]